MKSILFLVFVIALIILGPLATIWSLNKLFPILNIDYNFETWLAAVILAGVFKTTITRKE